MHLCSGPVGFLGLLRVSMRGGHRKGDPRTGGEQVARDEQSVLHGHYARGDPLRPSLARNPDLRYAATNPPFLSLS